MSLPDDLFDALPRAGLSPPNGRTPKLKRWSGEVMRPYNGFTHDERVWNWQVAWWLRDCGVLPGPDQCNICRRRGPGVRLGYHAECYFTLDRMPVVCSGCHMKIHQRKSRPQVWERLVETHSRTSREWFALLPLFEEPDMAGWQRSRFPGADLFDLVSNPLYTLPAGVPTGIVKVRK